jgi:hypothetical protein
MPNDNAKALHQLLKVFDPSKIVSPEDVQAVLAGVVTLLSNNKKGVDALNAENKALVEKALAFVVDEIGKVRQDTVNSHTKLSFDTQTKNQKTLDEARAFISEARAAMPKDGKDADPAAVVPLVLEQIKLPEQKDVILDDGEAIVAKINQNPTDDEDCKIDASHIKNLPQPRGGSNMLHGGFRNVTVYDESTVIAKAMPFLKFTGTGVQATVVNGVVVVTIPGGSGSITAADEDATDSGNHTTFTISHTPVASTLLVINENTGQAVPASAYTNTTTSIIFNQSQQVDDGTGNLVTPTFRARYFY